MANQDETDMIICLVFLYVLNRHANITIQYCNLFNNNQIIGSSLYHMWCSEVFYKTCDHSNYAVSSSILLK